MFHAIARLIVVWGIGWSFGTLCGAEDSPGVSAFKRLLAAPSVIEQMVYRETLPPKAGAVIPMDVGISRSTNYAIYEVRWQPNAMSARTLESNLTGERLNAYWTRFMLWDDDFWFLAHPTNVSLYHMEHQRVRRGDVPPSYDAAWYRISRYGEILNLGLSHLRPGSVRWEGDQFSALGLADKKPMFVSGMISRLSNGVPLELSVRYSNTVSFVDYRVAYEYQDSGLSSYPKRVSSFVKHGPKETLYRSYEILSVHTGGRPMPQTHFDPDHWLQNPDLQLRFLTNDSMYIKLPSGKLMQGQVSIPGANLSPAEHYRNRYFYLAIGLLTVVFFRELVRTPQTKVRKIQ